MLYPTFLSRRSTVLSRRAAVATSDPTATEIGLSLLKKGANAAEAAVGIAAVLNLVDPGSTGLGGDCFVMFYDAASKTVKGINGSGRSPEALTLDTLNQAGISSGSRHLKIPFESPYSVTVPGAAAAWCDTIEHFGKKKLNLQQILQPAIDLAKEGYAVHEWSAHLQHKNTNKLKRTPFSFANDLLLGGNSPKHGEVMKNFHYGECLQLLAKEGKEGFYKGRIAEAIVDCVQQAGGCLAMNDMAVHQSTFDQPISTVYRNKRVWEMPPNGQGLVALIALNILSGLDLNSDDRFSTDCMHQIIESLHLAFADGFEHIADGTPSSNVDHLLSEEHSASRRKIIIDKKRAATHHYKKPTVNAGQDTVYFSIVDEDGNACSFINSIYEYYGCGLVPKGCGFVLNNRACNFSLVDGHPNCVAPRKKTYHTIIPAIVTDSKSDELYACFGIMGGFMQPQAHVQVLSNILDFNMDPQPALCAPRFCISYTPDKSPVVNIEEGIPEKITNELTALGHNVAITKGMDRVIFGRGQIIITKIDEGGNRVLWSASESRADGCALGY